MPEIEPLKEPLMAEKLDGAALLRMTQQPEEEAIPTTEQQPKLEEDQPFEEEREEPNKEDKPVEVDPVEVQPENEVKKTGAFEPPVLDDPKPVEEKPEELPTGRKAAQAAFAAKDREIRELKKQLNEVRPKAERAAELETQLASLPKVDPDLQTKVTAYEKEIQRLKDESEHYKKEFAVVAVDRSEEFQETVKKPWDEIVVPSIQVLTKSTNGEVNMSVVQDIALTEDPVARKEKLRSFKDRLEPDDYAELASVVPKCREVIQKNTALKKNAQETVALKQREQEQQRKQFIEKYESDVKKTFAERDQHFRKQFFTGVEDPELDKALQQSGQQAEALPWFDATPEVQATVRAALKNYPVAFAVLNKQLAKEKQKTADLEKQLKELQSVAKKTVKATPDAGATSSGQHKQDDVIEEFKGPLTGASLLSALG